MTEDRIGTHLRALEQDATPDRAFLDRVHDELAHELGLATRRAPAPAPSTGGKVAPSVRGRRRRLGARDLLLAAALAAGAGAAMLVGSMLLDRDVGPDLLDAVRLNEALRVGVAAGYPQAQAPNGAWGGFDVDLAELLAERLGVRAEVVVSSEQDLVSRSGAWDVAIPSLLRGDPVGEGFARTSVVHWWPVHLLVRADSVVQHVDELVGHRVCVVAGSAGAAWLALRPDAPGTTLVEPPEVGSITAADDAGCRALLADGRVDAFVTAATGPADLVVHPDARALGGPVALVPMAPFVSTSGADPASLIARMDAAIAALREDGTLLDLSRRRFGADLVTPPIP
jgi:polar amino acid transport system substrate-binding protein